VSLSKKEAQQKGKMTARDFAVVCFQAGHSEFFSSLQHQECPCGKPRFFVLTRILDILFHIFHGFPQSV
jgi:hypothetical protein